MDHRSLVAQREIALARGDERAAEALDRAPEAKLGPVASAIERREQRAAEREGHVYVPVTERGAQVHEARQARTLLAELARVRAEVRERAELARETYAHAREEGTDRVRAGARGAPGGGAAAGGSGPSLEHGRERGDEPQHGRAASAGRDQGSVLAASSAARPLTVPRTGRWRASRRTGRIDWTGRRATAPRPSGSGSLRC